MMSAVRRRRRAAHSNKSIVDWKEPHHVQRPEAVRRLSRNRLLPSRGAGILHRHHGHPRNPRLGAGDADAAHAALCARAHQPARRGDPGHRHGLSSRHEDDGAVRALGDHRHGHCRQARRPARRAGFRHDDHQERSPPAGAGNHPGSPARLLPRHRRAGEVDGLLPQPRHRHRRRARPGRLIAAAGTFGFQAPGRLAAGCLLPFDAICSIVS
nr:hypothetical protein SHINE37_42165 [Rhizobiaceae bacterium]